MSALVKNTSLAAIALAASVGMAHAATVQTQTINSLNGSFSFDQFSGNPADLLSVSWTLTGTGTSSGSVKNNNPDPETGTVNTTLSASFDNPSPFGLTSPSVQIGSSGTVTVDPGQTVQIPAFDIVISQSDFLTSGLAPWIGSGTVGFDVETERGSTFFSSGEGEQDVDLSFQTTGFWTGTVTYQVIPLPAAGWLLLSGVFGLGGLGWWRRRNAA